MSKLVPCWVVEIDGLFFIKYKTRLFGRWTKNPRSATRMTAKQIMVYLEDWKSFRPKRRRVTRDH